MSLSHAQTEPCGHLSTHLVGIKLALEDTLGLDVSVTTRNSLHPMMKDDIEREAIRVF